MPKILTFTSIALLILLMPACSSTGNSDEPGIEQQYIQPIGIEVSPEETAEDGVSMPNSPAESPTTVFDPAGRRGRGGGFVVLDNPVMILAAQATWLEADQIVLGVEQNGEAQAFPIAQMAYHHIANTYIGGEPYLVTY